MKEKLITPDMLREAMIYDPDTGMLYWKERPLEHFKGTNAFGMWNTRYAGKPALNCTNKRYGYKEGNFMGFQHRTHRVAWAIYHGEWPKQYIDHINGDRADNRLCNLRDVSKSDNHKNMSLASHSTSGVIGVSWNKKLGKWAAYIYDSGKRNHLGVYASKEEAVAARKAAETELGFHKNHGRINHEHVAKVLQAKRQRLNLEEWVRHG